MWWSVFLVGKFVGVKMCGYLVESIAVCLLVFSPCLSPCLVFTSKLITFDVCTWFFLVCLRIWFIVCENFGNDFEFAIAGVLLILLVVHFEWRWCSIMWSWQWLEGCNHNFGPMSGWDFCVCFVFILFVWVDGWSTDSDSMANFRCLHFSSISIYISSVTVKRYHSVACLFQ